MSSCRSNTPASRSSLSIGRMVKSSPLNLGQCLVESHEGVHRGARDANTAYLRQRSTEHEDRQNPAAVVPLEASSLTVSLSQLVVVSDLE
jgi:hypothetical protein